MLGELCGENAIVHLMSGKAVQRAFRGHLLLKKCLNKMIVTEMLDEKPDLAPLVSKAEESYIGLIEGKITMDTATTSETLETFASAIATKRDGLRERSETSQLWLLIKADRSG